MHLTPARSCAHRTGHQQWEHKLHLCRNTSLEHLSALLLSALQHGLASDLPADWSGRVTELAMYAQQFGDAHCGFRDADDVILSRWCKKQRADFLQGKLSAEQIAQLCEVGFEFDDERAEWLRWYAELKVFMSEGAHRASDWELNTAQKELYLTNWCAVQRIARRSGVMRSDRIQLLDELGFDWTGADPLS
jgi:hypothetical protein